ncbi:hypothetical protein ES703_87001 [subsurface metagenome]
MKMQLRKSQGQILNSNGLILQPSKFLPCPSLQRKNGKNIRNNTMKIINKGYLHEINDIMRNIKRKERHTTKNTIKPGISETRKKSQRGPKNTKQNIRKKSKPKLNYIVKHPEQENSHAHVEENIAGASDSKSWSFWVEFALNVASQIRGPYKSIISMETVRLIARTLGKLEHYIYISANFHWKKQRKNIKSSALTAMSSRPGR